MEGGEWERYIASVEGMVVCGRPGSEDNVVTTLTIALARMKSYHPSPLQPEFRKRNVTNSPQICGWSHPRCQA
jgi:hypothetical protein